MRLPIAVLTVLASALPALAGDGPKKPRLDLRATPRQAFSPVNVFLTAELTGGDDVEEYYCPELEWDWDDGGKSVQAADCPPYEPGTVVERRFTAEHEYRRSGTYNVSITLRRGKRTLARTSTRVTVRPGFGERPTSPYSNDPPR